MPKFQVEFYETKNGCQPVREFILQQDVKMQAKIVSVINVLQENGNELREPYSKYLVDGIFELRIKFGSNISRVLYFFYAGSRIILTNGFVKKTEKTDAGEIDKARKYRADFMKREGLL